NMTKLPGAMVIIDPRTELNAVREARKLGITTVCLIDTDSDPALADIPIPGNDDAMRSIDVIVASLCAAVAEGKTARAQQAPKETEGGEQPRKRSKRAQFSADAPPPADDAPAEAPVADAAPAAEAPAPEAVTVPAEAPAPAANG
ncbi:MAG: 30S ribosomal protein S2, partial [Planctomycetota bacterium]